MALAHDALSESSAGTSPSTSYINDATVTAQLKTSLGVSVGGALTLSYVAASDGKYRSLIEEDTAFALNVSYEYHIDADAGSDLKAHWEVPVVAIKRVT